MRQHEREIVVRKARMKLDDAIGKWLESKSAQELTGPEFVQVVTRSLSRQLELWTKHAIRDERHPGNPSQSGGLE